ncbi:MAG TPA: cupin-like domain-containing protein [Parvularculaceae bacterium]|nr:cupin-like domain-containing protein [Parvularculaceae bacterium]
MTIFEPVSADAARAYPGRAFRLKHRLAGHPLLSIEALADLAARLPESAIECGVGDAPVDQNPDDARKTGLSAVDAIRRIGECGSWVALKNVGRDPRYAALLEECLAEIEPVILPATGRMEKRLGFIFISSPGAVTPFHMDPEHNILMQIAGTKRFHLYSGDAGIVSDEGHELYHLGAAHRNLRHRPDFDAHMTAYDLGPGDALYAPVKAPHWVKNGEAASVSFSITWRSRASLNEARLRLANGFLRRRGAKPPAPGERPARDAAAIFAQRVAARLAHPFG